MALLTQSSKVPPQSSLNMLRSVTATPGTNSWYQLVLTRITNAVMKYYNQKQTGEDKFYLTYTLPHHFIIRESQNRNSNMTGTLRQKLIQRPWKNVAYWLVLQGLLYFFFLIKLRTINPELAPPKMGCCPHQLLIQKMPYSLAYSPVLWRHFLN